MGSWNETCSLTRLPIMEGDLVVVFHTVSVPAICFDSVHELGSVPLMLGLHSKGVYADYGRVTMGSDALTTNNEAWCARALTTNDFWRAISIEGDVPRLIALEGQQLLYGLTRAYDLLGAPGEEFYPFSQWLSQACTAFADANKAWANDPANQQAVPFSVLKDALNRHGMNAFKERWLIAQSWMHAQGMLMATQGRIMVHADAFETLVRATLKPKEKARWATDWQEWHEVDREMKKLDLSMSKGWTRAGAREWTPLSKPIRTSHTPVYSHYWHTVEPDDALKSITMQDLMEYNAFKAGVCRTRVNLHAGQPGGQDKNRTLLATVVSSVQPR